MARIVIRQGNFSVCARRGEIRHISTASPSMSGAPTLEACLAAASGIRARLSVIIDRHEPGAVKASIPV